MLSIIKNNGTCRSCSIYLSDFNKHPIF
ncbi:MAG: hypothetical protein ACK4M9_14055 [Anaerobacillus sp.]